MYLYIYNYVKYFGQYIVKIPISLCLDIYNCILIADKYIIFDTVNINYININQTVLPIYIIMHVHTSRQKNSITQYGYDDVSLHSLTLSTQLSVNLVNGGKQVAFFNIVCALCILVRLLKQICVPGKISYYNMLFD